MNKIKPTAKDTYYMTLAIAEAKKGKYITRPNPAVGCIFVSNDEVIGQGHTSPAGGNHAEINALVNAKESGNIKHIRGSTAYVTLEPCSHYGRTPPCANALINAGVTKVVIAGLDPNPQVAGRGVSMLEEAGVEVIIFSEGGLIHQQAEDINKGFLKAMRVGMPYVRLKIATSLDGRTAMSSGESKWITGIEAREDVQALRALSGAIITGSQTVIDDNPSLNIRSKRFSSMGLVPQPKPVIVDRRQRLSIDSKYIICQRDDVLFWQEDDLNKLLKILASEYHSYDVMVESGAKLAGAFITAGLVDELIIYQAPCLLGTDSKPMLEFSIEKLSDQYRFEVISHQVIGNDLKVILKR